MDDVRHTGSRNIFFGESNFGGKRTRAMELMEALIPLKETIGNMRKGVNKTDRYAEMSEKMHKRGISFSLNFIFGWDCENPTVFDSTVGFSEEHKVPAAYFNVLMPTPGTSLYAKLKAEDRILNEEEMGRRPGHLCHVKPAWCTPAELEQNVQRMYRQFYAFSSMARSIASAPRAIEKPSRTSE